jgi:predicted solute-binding protein
MSDFVQMLQAAGRQSAAKSLQCKTKELQANAQKSLTASIDWFSAWDEGLDLPMPLLLKAVTEKMKAHLKTNPTSILDEQYQRLMAGFSRHT